VISCAQTGVRQAAPGMARALNVGVKVSGVRSVRRSVIVPLAATETLVCVTLVLPATMAPIAHSSVQPTAKKLTAIPMARATPVSLDITQKIALQCVLAAKTATVTRRAERVPRAKLAFSGRIALMAARTAMESATRAKAHALNAYQNCGVNIAAKIVPALVSFHRWKVYPSVTGLREGATMVVRQAGMGTCVMFYAQQNAWHVIRTTGSAVKSALTTAPGMEINGVRWMKRLVIQRASGALRAFMEPSATEPQPHILVST
jgi:hypothetical protein